MSVQKKEGPQLNASQRRSVEALLESLEGTLLQIERLIPDSAANEHGVTVVNNDLPGDFAEQAPVKIAALRARLATLAESLEVSRRRISKRRTVRGILSAQLVRVEDVTPARLRGYGTLHPSFATDVSPELKALREELKGLLDLVRE